MNCVFPLIKKAIEEGNITVDDIAKSVGEDVVIIKEKLCGKEDFIINEAMTINVELFPDIPFKTLFSHYIIKTISYQVFLQNRAVCPKNRSSVGFWGSLLKFC